MSTTMVLPVQAARGEGLVHSASRGDRAAFGELYRAYSRMVHGILLARVGPGEAEDLLQEVFLTAMSRLPALREKAAFGGWLASIARSKALDALRARREMVEMPEQLASGAPAADVRVEAERVLAVIRTLPEAYRETLVLRLVEGLTGPEIAGQVGLTPDSVRVNLTRGMKLLRERLEGGKR
jgi:RNA polymerase sigma-70 factor (ECF subfamily)